jgi:hypothetical protein
MSRAPAELLPRRTLVAALAAGAALRLFMLWFIAYRFDAGDALSYDELAANVVEHGVFGYGTAPPIEPTVLRAPGYPALVAAVYAVAGVHAHRVVELVQIAISLATCWLLAHTLARVVAARDDLPEALPAVALWASVLSPFDAVFCGALLSETLCTALVVAGMCAPLGTQARWRWLAAGAAFGAASLVRDVFLLFVPFAAVAWALLQPRPREWRGIAVAGAALVLGMALALAPWTARNHVHTGRFIPVSQGSLGSSLWMGAWALDGSFTAGDASGVRFYPDEAFVTPDERTRVDEAMATTDGVVRHRIFMDLFWSRLRHEPHLVVARWFVRIPRLWLSTRFDIFVFRPEPLAYGTLGWTLLKIFFFGLDAVLVFLGLAGIVLAWRRRILPLLWLATPMAYITLLFLPLHSFESRYAQPALPMLTVLASFAAIELGARVARRRAAAGPSITRDRAA